MKFLSPSIFFLTSLCSASSRAVSDTITVQRALAELNFPLKDSKSRLRKRQLFNFFRIDTPSRDGTPFTNATVSRVDTPSRDENHSSNATLTRVDTPSRDDTLLGFGSPSRDNGLSRFDTPSRDETPSWDDAYSWDDTAPEEDLSVVQMQEISSALSMSPSFIFHVTAISASIVCFLI